MRLSWQGAHDRDEQAELADSAAAPTRWPGRRTRTEGLAPRQGAAERGFAGAPRDLPHGRDMAVSFGRRFDQVRAYGGAPARQAAQALGAEAYALGDQIAFGAEAPAPEVVAHELAHTLGHGEGTARDVQRAVASGQPAGDVLAGRQPENEAGVHCLQVAITSDLSPAALVVGDDGMMSLRRDISLARVRDYIPLCDVPPVFAGLEGQLRLRGEAGAAPDARQGVSALRTRCLLIGDITAELALGVPGLSVSGGGRLRVQDGVDYTYNGPDDFHVDVPELELHGQFLVAASLGPGNVMRVELTLADLVMAQFRAMTIDQDGVHGADWEWIEEYQAVIDFLAEVMQVVSDINQGILMPANLYVTLVSGQGVRDAINLALAGTEAVVGAARDVRCAADSVIGAILHMDRAELEPLVRREAEVRERVLLAEVDRDLASDDVRHVLARLLLALRDQVRAGEEAPHAEALNLRSRRVERWEGPSSALCDAPIFTDLAAALGEWSAGELGAMPPAELYDLLVELGSLRYREDVAQAVERRVERELDRFEEDQARGQRVIDRECGAQP